MKKLKRLLAFMLSFFMVVSLVPMEVFAAPLQQKKIEVNDVKYRVTYNKGQLISKELIISGTKFMQRATDTDTATKSVIKDITVDRGADNVSISKMKNVELQVSDTIIKIIDKNKGSNIFNVNGKNKITIIQTDSSNITYLDIPIKNLPTLESLKRKVIYVGEPVILNGKNLKYKKDIINDKGEIVNEDDEIFVKAIIDGATQVIAKSAEINKEKIESNDEQLVINPLSKTNLTENASIELVKEAKGQKDGKSDPKLFVTTVVEYQDMVTVYEKLSNLERLEVLPSQGPATIPSMITIKAYEEDLKTVDMDAIKDSFYVLLRKDIKGVQKEIKLDRIKFNKGKNGKIESISGWTLDQEQYKRLNITKDDLLEGEPWDVVIKDKNNPKAEAVKENGYRFVNTENVPKIIEVTPKKGPTEGGTDVLIKGKNIIFVNEDSLNRYGETIKPNLRDIKLQNGELTINYYIDPNTKEPITYSGDKVESISRTISVEIGKKANITKNEIKLLEKIKTDEGIYNYMVKNGAEDGIAVRTQDSIPVWQDVVVNTKTTITIKKEVNGKEIKKTIVLYESAIAKGEKGFLYEDSNPKPEVESVEFEYGFMNDTEGENPSPGDNDDKIKPLMIRLHGKNFQYIKEDKGNGLVEDKYPNVKFLVPLADGTMQEIEARSSTAKGDIKVLQKTAGGMLKPVDGKYEKLGDTLVVSITSDKAKALRERINGEKADPERFKQLKTMIKVVNPSGRANEPTVMEGPFFNFRRPDTKVDDNNYQIKIQSVKVNNSEVKKLPSTRSTTVRIHINAKNGIDNVEKTMVTLDGADITKNIKAITPGEKDGYDIDVELNPVSLNLRGETRLQVIIFKGLMDSYKIAFEDMQGPEIKEIIPPEGNNGTMVVIKRDDINNAVFVKPNSDPNLPIDLQIGSKVIIDNKDVNEGLYGTPLFSDDNKFKDHIGIDKEHGPGKVSIPGKYVYVADKDTIYLYIPEGLSTGKHNIQIQNPDGTKSSVPKTFYIKEKFGSTKIGTINPNIDDKDGGIVTTITAKNITGFKPSVDVYFGSQKGEVLGYNVDKTEVYVKVPPLKDFEFSDDPKNQVYSYSVPVTVQNTEDKSTDTIINGFTYLNPGHYQMSIDEIRNKKYLTDDTAKQKNIGVKGDEVVISGGIFFVNKVNGKLVLPNVLFGYTSVPAEDIKIWGNESDLNFDKDGRAMIKGLVVKVPKKPDINVGADGAVDVTVQNPDGRKAVKEKGFIYLQSKPEIIQDKSRLEASRFKDTIVVTAKDVIKDGLIVAFGDKSYKKPIVDKETEINTENEIENIVVKYNSEDKTVGFFYKKPDGKEIPLNVDWKYSQKNKKTANTGKLETVGDKIIVGIDWSNPQYHSTEITQNPDLVRKLNKEFMEVSLQRESNTVNVLKVRRGLGEVKKFVTDPKTGISQLTINTPYNDKVEKTTINLINYDGSVATAPFLFHGGIEPPLITDIVGSKDVAVGGKNAKVYSTDMNVESEITIVGENFKDVQKITIGEQNVQIISVSPDYKSVKVKVPRGSEDLAGKFLPIVVYTKQGAAYSDKRDEEHKDLPPVYFTYILTQGHPVITSITPSKGPQTGGTKVRIDGSGFSDKNEFGVKGNIEVYFGDKKGTVENIIKDDYGNIKALDVVTPSVDDLSTPINVYVKNADKARSENHPFNYISQPVITEVEGDFIFNAEKGEEDVKVTIKGKNFYNPQKVILGGNIIDLPSKNKEIENGMMLGVHDDGTNRYVQFKKDKDGNIIGIEIPVDAIKDEKEKSTTSFTVTLPTITYEQMKKLQTQNLIVVNADGGTSPEKRVTIVPPIPKAPMIIATPGYNNTVNLKWKYSEKELNKATKFEVYAKEYGAENDYKHLGDTSKAQIDKDGYYKYTAKNLKPDTRYQFKVRVMNLYGEAKDFGYATVKTLNPRDDHKLQEKLNELDRANTNIRQYGTAVIVADTLQRTVGTKENVINLSNFPQVKTKEVRIATDQIKVAPNAKIQIVDKNMKMDVGFNAFSNLNQVKNSSSNAVVSIKFKSGDNKLNTKVTKAVPRNKKRVSQVQNIEMTLQEPLKKYPIYFTQAPLKLTLIPNQKAKNAQMARYNEKTGKIENINGSNIKNGGNYVLLGTK